MTTLRQLDREVSTDIQSMNLDAKAVQHALALLLKDPFFLNGPSSAAFLSFVVSTTLNGDGGRLKAYTIAVDALGKPDSFDPQNDPSVRVMAYRIRTALTEYNAKSNSASVEITMALGSYAAVFNVKQSVKQSIEINHQ